VVVARQPLPARGACRNFSRPEDVTMKRVVITTGIVAVIGGAATILFMPSCDPDCEVRPKPSVVLQIVAKQPTAGAINSIAAEKVWYEWTDEDGRKVSKQAECMDDECTEWMLGEGSPGTYDYHATVCGQQYDASVTLELNDEGCEVDTQMVELPVNGCGDVIPPEPPTPPQAGTPDLDITQKTCTLEARPSVLVSVVGQDGSRLVPLPADRVWYEIHEPPTPEHPEHPTKGEHPTHPEHPEHPNSGELPGICLNEACSLFAAGLEKTGDFKIGAEVCGEVVTTRATVVKTSNGCHVETQHVQLMGDASKCKEPLVYTPTPLNPKPECDRQDLRASAVVFPVTDGGDVWMPYPTENMIFVHDGQRHQGYCAQPAANGKCTWWVMGGGHIGRFQAFTETCGVESAVSFSVEATADGCYPETEFVPVFVDTHGCIRSAWPPVGNPPPTTPAIKGDVTQ
jgi:hypothetical protein